MSVNEGLQRLRAIRRGHRAAATKSINEINGILSTTLSSESSTKLNALKLKLEWKQRTLNELDAKILNEVKIEDIEKEIEEREVIVMNITEAKEKIVSAIRANTNTSRQVKLLSKLLQNFLQKLLRIFYKNHRANGHRRTRLSKTTKMPIRSP